MYDDEELSEIREAHAEVGGGRSIRPSTRHGERRDRFATVSNHEVDRLHPADVADIDYEEDLGFPGEEPYTRGVYPTMHRGRTWTMRQFAGFGTAEETNERFHYLTDEGQTGLSTAFDMPSLMGLDSDDPMSLGEVGRGGRRRRHPPRHGGAVRRYRRRRGLDLLHDQPQRARDLRDVRRHRGPTGRAARGASRHPPKRHAQGVHRAEGVGDPRSPPSIS